MVKEFGRPSHDSAAASDSGDGETRDALDDPLLELARIVHKNNQTGEPVTSNRVGSTDYFADLEDVVPGFTRDDQKTKQPSQTEGRVEPSFGFSSTPAESAASTQGPAPSQSPSTPAEPNVSHASVSPFPGLAKEEPAASVTAPSADDFSVSDNFIAEFEASSAPVTSVQWPSGGNDFDATSSDTGRAPNIQLSPEDLLGGDEAEDQASGFAEPQSPSAASPVFQSPISQSPDLTQAPEADPLILREPVSREPMMQAANDGLKSAGFSPSQDLQQNLEQNLESELEDELIGAFRQSFDPFDPQQASATVEEKTEDKAPMAAQPPVVPPLEIPNSTVTAPKFAQSVPTPDAHPEGAPASGPQGDPLDVLARMASQPAPFDTASADTETRDVETEIEPVASPTPVSTFSAAPTIGLQAMQEELLTKPTDSVGAPSTQLDDNDDGLFGEPTVASQSSLTADFAAPRFDTASLNAASSVQKSPVPTQSDDIDDMAWPAAAAAVPQIDEDETRPPPEGYDLDAVAKAMQESDPSLDGSGVLPPHPPAQQQAVSAEKPKSKKAMLAAAAVLGVAVLGGGAFMFMDSGGIEAPTGAPPIIAGLQGPLKVLPETSANNAGTDGSKLIYDRVGGTEDTSRERLVVQDTPEPAALPPAPQTGSDPLVPGTPKRVRTVIVKPDGTIVPSGGSQTTKPRVISTVPVTVNPDTPAAPAPAVPQPAEPTTIAQPSGNETNPAPAPAQPTTVVTTPVVVNPGAEGQDTASTATPAPETQGTQTDAPTISVTPRRKPPAPVRVATAPVTTTPVQTRPVQNSGPLDLSNPGPAPVQTQTPATSGGTIASGTYIVQVTSQRSEAAARNAYQGLQRRYPGVLGNVNAVIVRADLGDRGTFYRARIPANSRGAAFNLCESLKSAGGDCFVRQN
ncbi:sporulation domain-containing protein [Roseibium sp. TrichSKD4]|uniref:SPOR domain-containing protein n=1 Tax=Roseibium sp. TrichSKD4 TaxID=744980 RepID=UPI0001E572F3|nr:SPOR domain-containing protein [Roseibium sp. TrichSKD4]EFO29758.1 sporulation domain-containing protein [Roseibium sp. TrichSKD4]